MITVSMDNCRVALLALVFVSFGSALHSQSQTSVGSEECSDLTYVASATCTDVSQQTTVSPLMSGASQPAPSALDDITARRATTSSTTEISPLRGELGAQTARKDLPPEPLTEFQKFVAATTGRVLPVFGSDLFRNVPATYAPSDLAPASLQYIIGPDDELRIRIWGQISYSGNLRVDRSGNIYLPQAGSVHVAGLPFSALDQHVRAAVGRMYRNFDLSVDLGRIRSIQVYVTGEARRPGVYTLSSLSSLVNAVFASGGPSAQGSLRHIVLKRDGQLIADFDLYALLLRGDKSQDVRLLPEDVLYIPPTGPQVAILGSVRKPAIYEMKDAETLGDLLASAGRTTALASSERISLDRVVDHQQRGAMELALDSGGLATRLADGDIVHVFSIIPSYSKTVTLRGSVANPGRFGWHAGMHLSDVIPDKDSLVSRDYWWKRSHLGLPSEEFEPAITTIGADPRKPETTSRGFTDSVSQQTLTLALTKEQRQSEDERANTQPRAGQMGASGSLAAQLQQPSGADTSTLRPKNEVRLAAMGINWNYAVIERVDPATLKTSLIPFDLGKLVLQRDASQNLAVEPGDTITIFSQEDIRVPLEEQTKYVTLGGEFAHAGVYSVEPGETLRDLVRRAGGMTAKAYLYGAEFNRESTRILQQQRLDEYVRSVSMEAERGTQALAVSGTSSSASASDVSASRAVTDQLIGRLSQVRATGRIVLGMRPASAGIDEIPALNLENGDRFMVPPIPDTVNVVGAVYDQNSFLYKKSRAVTYYLKQSGGPTRNADKGHAFVIRADGSVLSRTAVKSNWSYLGGNGFNDIRLDPGDTIVMPDKTLRPTALRGVLDWTQVFSQVALGAAAINVLH